MVSLHAKGIVWDFDGTLLKSYQIQKDVLTELFRKRGIAVPSDDEFLRHYHGHLRDSIRGLSHLDGQPLEALYEDFIRAEESYYDLPDRLYFSDAVDLVNRAHAAGLKQVIISNRPHFNDARKGSPRNLAKREPMTGKIDAVVCGDDNDFHKPDARVMDAIEQQLNLKRTELLVIGDQHVDVELADNLGAPVVLIARGEEVPHLDKLSDGWRDRVYIVKSLKDVSVQLPQGAKV